MKKILIIVLSVCLVFTLMPAMAFAAGTTHSVSTSAELAAAISTAADGDTIYLYNGTYSLPITTISKNLTFTGQSEAGVVINPSANTGSTDDARGWILVAAGKTVTMSDLTLDGTGHEIYIAILVRGALNISNLTVRNIRAPASSYAGLGVYSYGPVNASNITMSNIGRVGIHSKANLTLDGFNYTGKGAGDWLDYGIEIGTIYGADTPAFTVNIKNVTISDCQGVATADGSTSAGIYITTYFYTLNGGTGPVEETVSIDHANTSNCFVGIQAGYKQDEQNEYSKTTITASNFLGNTSDLGLFGKGTGSMTATGNFYSSGVPVITVSAGNSITSSNNLSAPVSISQNTNVTAGVEPSYVIVIPASVDFGTLQKNTGTMTEPFPVSARNVVIEQGSQINVGVAGITAMKDKNGLGTNILAYGLRNSSASVTSGNNFASFIGNRTETGSVNVDTSAINMAGSYKGTMVFTISYAE